MSSAKTDAGQPSFCELRPVELSNVIVVYAYLGRAQYRTVTQLRVELHINLSMVAKLLVSSGRQPRVIFGALGRLDRGRFCAVPLRSVPLR